MALFRLVKRAETDLDEIWCTIALDNVDAADRIIDILYEVAELLASRPKMGRARSELAAELMSFATNTPYVIYYELAPNSIATWPQLRNSPSKFVSPKTKPSLATSVSHSRASAMPCQ